VTFTPVGGVTVVVRPDLAWDYLHLQLAGLSSGLESEWFYIHNDIDGPVSEFIMQPRRTCPLLSWCARRKTSPRSTSTSGSCAVGFKLG
jgi:hypothetical protein